MLFLEGAVSSRKPLNFDHNSLNKYSWWSLFNLRAWKAAKASDLPWPSKPSMASSERAASPDLQVPYLCRNLKARPLIRQLSIHLSGRYDADCSPSSPEFSSLWAKVLWCMWRSLFKIWGGGLWYSWIAHFPSIFSHRWSRISSKLRQISSPYCFASYFFAVILSGCSLYCEVRFCHPPMKICMLF